MCSFVKIIQKQRHFFLDIVFVTSYAKHVEDDGGGGQFCFISCFKVFLVHLVNTTLTNTGKYEIYFDQTVGWF
jgi:hypothetical protein